MDYKVTFKDSVYDLPPYTMEVAEKFESVEKLNAKTTDLKFKLKNLYKLETELIGKEAVLNAIGEFSKADLNDINILYLEMIRIYNQPVQDYRSAEREEMIDSDEIKQITNLLNAVQGANLMKTENGTPYKIK